MPNLCISGQLEGTKCATLKTLWSMKVSYFYTAFILD